MYWKRSSYRLGQLNGVEVEGENIVFTRTGRVTRTWEYLLFDERGGEFGDQTLGATLIYSESVNRTRRTTEQRVPVICRRLR